MVGSQRADSMGEEHGVGMETSVGNLGNYYDEDSCKPGLEVDYAYYRERYCIGIEGRRRASKELAESGLPKEVAEEPEIAAADAVAYADETDTDCKCCKSLLLALAYCHTILFA